ncbi:hypothetical protein FB33_2532 [Cutibacterium acnes]|nr:hypothetical protein FB33_2532 [Cutibacterium acnes]
MGGGLGGWGGKGLVRVVVGVLGGPMGLARHDYDAPATVVQTSTQSPQQAMREPLTW